MNTKILVVEDSKTDMLLIKNILEEHQLLFAHDGVEAMEVLKREPKLDLMILDLNMPRMNGFEVLEKIRSNPEYDGMMILILTNYDEPENEVRGLELGAVDYITKPFMASIVRTRVNTHLKIKMQMDLLERQKKELMMMNEELESFSYSVSHDLRAPLNIIKIYSDFLYKSISKGTYEQQLEDLNTVMEATNHMYQLIEDILQLSKVGRVEFDFQPIDLSELAEEIIRKLRLTQMDRSVNFIIGKNIMAKADVNLMEICLFNLLQNAWKYTSKASEATIEFGSKVQGEKIIYFVKDNGAGFDMENAGNLFTKIGRLHTSSEFEGTGVGLTIVNRILKRHNGDIWAESEVGKGTTFYFTLGTDALKNFE